MAAIIPTDSFFKWLDESLKAKGWSDYRLVKEAKLSGTSFMTQLRQGKPIGYEACAKIADALSVPRYEVYARAGLDPMPHPESLVSEITSADDTDRKIDDAIDLELEKVLGADGVKKLKAWRSLRTVRQVLRLEPLPQLTDLDPSENINPKLQNVIESWGELTDDDVAAITQTVEQAKQRVGTGKPKGELVKPDRKRTR